MACFLLLHGNYMRVHGATLLAVGVPRNAEKLRPTEVATYEVTGLQPEAEYEIKISYPAVTPAVFEVQFEAGRAGGRQLQNVHKEMFSTDTTSRIRMPSGDATTIFTVRALRESYSYDKVRQSEDYIVYNIAVGPLLLGVPTEALPLAVLAVVGLFAVWRLSSIALQYIQRTAHHVKD